MSESPPSPRDPAAGLSLDAFAAPARALDAPAFVAAYGQAFFLHQGALGAPGRPPRWSELTVVAESRHRDRNVDLPFVAFAIRSRGRDASAPVTIGRARDNDIVLGDPSVSKLHALVRAAPGGELGLEDARSQNGTYVDDRAAPVSGRGEPLALRSGAVARLGSIELTFLTAEELMALVRALT